MKAEETQFLKFIKKSPQFIIPIYQRTYRWGENECKQLYEDILRAGKNEQIISHFMGSVIYIQESQYSVSMNAPLLVIDGQQRLTTLILLLIALHDTLNDDEEIDEDFSKVKIKNRYLIDPDERDDKKYKLILSQTDKDTLIALMDKERINSSLDSIRIRENYGFFKENLANRNELRIVCNGILKLQIVDISLNREYDNPQLIFESMNSTGKELTQADLIRNYILMGLKPKLQTKLYTNYWYAMELDFGQEDYQKYFDNFIRHYLTLKTRNIPNQNKVYEAFKKYHREQQRDIEQLVVDIRKYAKYFCNMALGREKEKALSLLFMNLLELKVDVAYPLLLELYDDYDNNILVKSDFECILQLLESYIFRRAICGIPTNSLNKVLTHFTKGIRKEKYLEGMKANFSLLDSYRRFPKNEEFKNSLVIKDLYNFSRKHYLFRKLENFGRKEQVSINDYTIEHILPQNERISKEWQESLGVNYQEIKEKYLHTLGNLTLTGYNSEYSDKSFREKRDMEGGFAQSPLKLNVGLRELETWNEKTIQNRAERLADESLKLWPYPTLNNDILQEYKPKKNLSYNVYTINHYQH